MINTSFSPMFDAVIAEAGLKPRLSFNESAALADALTGIGYTIMDTGAKLAFLAEAFRLFDGFTPSHPPAYWVCEAFRDIEARALDAPTSATGCRELMADIAQLLEQLEASK